MYPQGIPSIMQEDKIVAIKVALKTRELLKERGKKGDTYERIIKGMFSDLETRRSEERIVDMSKIVESARFHHGVGLNSIDIVLLDEPKTHITIFPGITKHEDIALSERELDEVIAILSREKEVMLKQSNFPPIYEEMLTSLIKDQTWYRTKKVKKGEEKDED